MRKARCKICRNPDLRSLIIKLYEDGFTYRQIIKFLRDKFHYNIALGTLSNHFSICENIGVFELKLLPNEKLLTKEEEETLTKAIVNETLKEASNEEINNIAQEYERKYQGKDESPITTQYTLLEEIDKAYNDYPEYRTKALEKYFQKLEKLGISIPTSKFDNQA
jgi:hypothetical protein